MKMNPKVSIIILNWNGLKDTIECLESVKKIDYSNYETIVVDNGSFDRSAEEIRKRFPRAMIIENKKNLGYAEGNNVGIRFAIQNNTDYILILNNDIVVYPDILKEFLKGSQCYPEAGILGANIFNYYDHNNPCFIGGKWNSDKLDFDSIWATGTLTEKSTTDPIVLDFVTGCCLFFHCSLIEKIGMFEPKFFLTAEETDWCSRAQKKGIKSAVLPHIKILHKVSASFGGWGSPLRTYFIGRNRLFWAKRNLEFYSRWKLYLSIYKIFLPNTFNDENYPLLKRIYWDLLGLKKNYYFLIASIVGIWDFIFNRFGFCPKVILYLDKHFKSSKRSSHPIYK